MNDTAPTQSPSGLASGMVGRAADDGAARSDAPSVGVAGLIAELEAADPADAPELADRIARLLAERVDRAAESPDATVTADPAVDRATAPEGPPA